MKELIIAKRYARALFNLAREHDLVESAGLQITAFSDYCKQSNNLLSVLTNNEYPKEEREKVLDQILPKVALSNHIKNFLRLLLIKNRLTLLEDILTTYADLANQELNRCLMTVVSAVDLEPKAYKELAAHFGKTLQKEMILKKEKDPNLLGGVCVKIGDMVYDHTLKKQLADLELKLAGKSLRGTKT